jgi:hypothetical protein
MPSVIASAAFEYRTDPVGRGRQGGDPQGFDNPEVLLDKSRINTERLSRAVHERLEINRGFTDLRERFGHAVTRSARSRAKFVRVAT